MQELSEKYAKALHYAFMLHRGQMRKGNVVPYISHVLAVSSLVFEFGGSEDEAIAALLHDGPEDCGGLRILEDIRKEFGENIATIVQECSDSLVDTLSGEKKETWQTRKEKFIADIPHKSASALLVCACDKYHNLQTIVDDLKRDGIKTLERFTGKVQGTYWYYSSVLKKIKETEKVNPFLLSKSERLLTDFLELTQGNLQ